MVFSVGPQIVSKLGSNDSRIPLLVKDSFNSAGYTYFSYDAGGSVEGKDRLVDEVGTGAIWLFGIPLFKKIIDNTIYPLMNTSSEVDVRVAKNKDYLDTAIKHSPVDKFKKELIYAKNHTGKVKGLAIAKFLTSMGLTMLSYLGLTKLKQHMTRLNIEKEFDKKMKTEILPAKFSDNKTAVFSEISNFGAKSKNNTLSFGASKQVEEFMLNPIKNMILLDVGITTERLSNARTEGEFKEYAIKEGSFLFFVYCADKCIRKGMEYISQKFFKLPISLNADFLSSKLSEDILNNKKMQNEVREFSYKFGKDINTKEFYGFIFNNQDNAIVNAAKESGIISTIKEGEGKGKIDTRKYIDIDEMKKLVKNLQNYINVGKSTGDTTKYIEKIRTAKVGAIMTGFATCCAFLGYLVPKFIFNYRHDNQNGNKDFHVRTEYEKELAARAQMKTAA